MAGGTNKKTTGLPAWLVAANAETRAAAEEAMRQRRPQRKVHVWVHGSAGDWPGIVLDWRREGAGWAALALWTKDDGDFVSAWVDAESLSPVVLSDEITNGN